MGMVDIRHFRVFIASSSDTQPERDRMPGVLTRLNRILSVSQSVHLDLWRFEDDALPGLSDKGPQALIDPDLDKADLVVLIVWNRLGPGTAKEYARSVARWRKAGTPRVMIYVCERPSLLRTRQEVDDRGQVIDFIEKIGRRSLYRTFIDTDEFETNVHDDLLAIASQL